jgi:hypothetical protein
MMLGLRRKTTGPVELRSMSALGHLQTFAGSNRKSALLLKADIRVTRRISALGKNRQRRPSTHKGLNDTIRAISIS